MILERLYKQGIIQPPSWMLNSVHYLTIMGSEAYGCSSGSSDIDYSGFCVPPRYVIFPHEAGEIFGFDQNIERFEQWSQHHCIDKSTQKEYDFTIFNIVKFFKLCMENNPNVLDALFSPRRCVVHSTPMGEHVKHNRKIFLHKGSFHKFKGYSYSMLNRIGNSALQKRVDFFKEHNIPKGITLEDVNKEIEIREANKRTIT